MHIQLYKYRPIQLSIYVVNGIPNINLYMREIYSQVSMTQGTQARAHTINYQPSLLINKSLICCCLSFLHRLIA